jgi:hypothetical protein
MPMIAGRYYMNPAHGARIEQARREEAERAGKGPVKHVAIECADGGYVARVHRHAPGARDEQAGQFEAGGDGGQGRRFAAGGNAQQPAAQSSQEEQPTTHVFTDHNDLVEFLREELGSG